MASPRLRGPGGLTLWTMFWKIVAIVSFVAGVVVGAVFFQSNQGGSVPPARQQPPSTICPPPGNGPVDTSVI